MKFIVLFSLLFAFALSQHRVCFPEVFTTEQATLDPTQDDLYGAKIWFSVPLQMQRVDVDYIRVDDKPIDYKYIYLFDHKNGKYYEVTYHDNTATCKSGALSGKLDRACLSQNARKRGRELIGGVLNTDEYVEHEVVNKTRLRTHIQIAANVEIPTLAITRARAGHFIIDQFWNFEERVHHDAFRVPAVCTTNAVLRAEKKTFNEVMAEVNPIYAETAFFNRK